MRIAIDLSAAVTAGGVTYLLNFLPQLAELDKCNDYVVFLPPTRADLTLNMPSNLQLKRLAPVFHSPWRLLWQQCAFPFWLRKERIDLLFSPTDYTALTAPCKIVVAIQNSNPYWGPRSPTWRGRLRNSLIKLLSKLSARRATFILFMSYSSAELIGPQLGVDSTRFRVVYHGVDESFRATGQDSSDCGDWPTVGVPYILSVSNLLVHKDYETLIRGYAEVVSRYSIPHALLIAGAILDRRYYESLVEMARRLNIETRVRFLGNVPHQRMPRLYHHADLFVLPSLAETFGMPFAEAMTAGVPVIAADIPVVREVCQSAALYFPPRDARQLAMCVKEVLTNKELAIAMRRMGRQRARVFSWRTTAETTLQTFLDAVADRIDA